MTNIHPKIISHLKQDEKLRDLIESLPLQIDYTVKPVFNQLVKSVISQQLSTSAAQTIYNRFLNLLTVETDARLSILNIPDETLRSVGLSFQKAAYIKNIATHFLEQNYSENDWLRWDDDTIITKLTSIKGVGTWTVQMLLMFTLHREDVLPVDDLIIRKSIVKLYDIGSEGKQQLQDIHQSTEIWRPYRSIACRYLWAAKDSLLS